MWKKFFKVIKIVPGPVVFPGLGEIDLSKDNIPVDTIRQLFENDCPYLKPTPLGLDHFYGPAINEPNEIIEQSEILEPIEPQSFHPHTHTSSQQAEIPQQEETFNPPKRRPKRN